MNILGINAYHGNASAAVVCDGRLVAAVEEERFNRVKYAAGFPAAAIRYCLKEAGLKLEEIDHVAVPRNPLARLGTKLFYALRMPSFARGRAKVLVNTSDVEGFPNSYLQAWIRGVPVVTLIDPDAVIEREGLGIAARSPDQTPDAIRHLLRDPDAWNAASDRCRMFMEQEHGEEKVLAAYLDTFDEVMCIDRASSMIVSSEARHV